LFRQYIKSIVENSSHPFWKLRYHSAIPDANKNAQTDWTFTSSNNQASEATPETVTMTVLSPRFYTRFFCFGTITEAVMSECLDLNDNTRRLQIKGHHDMFQQEEQALLTKIRPYEFSRSALISRLDKFRWYIIHKMRSRMRSTESLSDQTSEIVLLPVDRLVLQNCHNPNFSAYIRYVLRALLTEKSGLGDEMYLQFLAKLIWFGLFIWCWSAMFSSWHMGYCATQHRRVSMGCNETLHDRTEVEGESTIAPLLKMIALQVYWAVRLVLDV